MLFLEEVRSRLTVVSLDEKEYFKTIQKCADRGSTSGRLRRADFELCREVRRPDNFYLEPAALSGARAGTDGQDANTVTLPSLHKKLWFVRRRVVSTNERS
jgi:hypothetical protein